jgi:transposase-like protein
MDADMQTCPRCQGTFNGAGISASPEARILCPDCSKRMVDERRERYESGRYWWNGGQR